VPPAERLRAAVAGYPVEVLSDAIAAVLHTELVGARLVAVWAQNWHSHSGHFYGVVTQGVLVEDLGCGRVQEFPEGTAFHTPPGVVHQFRNGGEKTVNFASFQVWDGSLPFNVPGEEPTGCN
jgi:mannose-6-phosphate isomerase-like protein (cupin superfamily)